MGFLAFGVGILQAILQTDGVIKIHQHQAVQMLRQKEHVMTHLIVGGRRMIGMTLQKEGIVRLLHGEAEFIQTFQEAYKTIGILDAIYLMLIRQNVTMSSDAIIQAAFVLLW